jgi:copper transport protein
VFSVGAASRSAVRPVGSSRAVDVALRWVRLCLLAGLVGTLAVAGVLVRVGGAGTVVRRARRRVLVLATGCAAVGVLAGQADLAVGVLRTPMGALFGTTWGWLWCVREVALVVAATVLAALVVGRAGRVAVAWAATGAVVMIVVVAEALGGRASGGVVTVVADVAHILAACLWLGLLPAIALLFAHDTRPLVRACLPSLARLVAASVGVLVVTGLYGAGRQVESASDLTGTPYGRTLLVKAGLLAVLLGLGAVAATRRRVAAQGVVAAVLLLAVGVLAETPPAPGNEETAGATRTGSTADLVVTVSATPNLPGPNGFTVIVASERRPPPAPVDSARLEFAAGGRTSVVALREIGPQRYVATTLLDAPGPVEINAVVRRAGVPVRIPISWTLDRPHSPAHPLAPYADGLALGLVGVGAGYVVRRRRAAR